MSIKETINRLFTSTAKITYEEKIYKDGHLYIKKEVKEGVEAEKEINKHMDSMSKAVDKFFKGFWL